MDKKEQEKKSRLLDSLERGMVMIHLDSRKPGVIVPPHLRSEPHLRLNLSYRFDPPDLTVGEWGVRCTLSFSGERFSVAIPWSALFAISSSAGKEFWMYPDDMPPELVHQAMISAKNSAHSADGKSQPVLREIANKPRRSGERGSDPDDPKPRKRHLRLIK